MGLDIVKPKYVGNAWVEIQGRCGLPVRILIRRRRWARFGRF